MCDNGLHRNGAQATCIRSSYLARCEDLKCVKLNANSWLAANISFQLFAGHTPCTVQAKGKRLPWGGEQWLKPQRLHFTPPNAFKVACHKACSHLTWHGLHSTERAGVEESRCGGEQVL